MWNIINSTNSTALDEIESTVIVLIELKTKESITMENSNNIINYLIHRKKILILAKPFIRSRSVIYYYDNLIVIIAIAPILKCMLRFLSRPQLLT